MSCLIGSSIVFGFFSSSRMFNLRSGWICRSLLETVLRNNGLSSWIPSSVCLAGFLQRVIILHLSTLIVSYLSISQSSFPTFVIATRWDSIRWWKHQRMQDPLQTLWKTAQYITLTANLWQLLSVSDYSTNFAPILWSFLAESASSTCLWGCHSR